MRGAPPRTPRGSGDLLRERLIEGAIAIVAERGDPSHVTIRAVTRQAGVSPTAFYLHFDTREALMAAVIERAFAEFRAAVGAGAQSGADPPGRLRAAGLAYMRFARERPALYAIIFGPHEHPEGEDGRRPGMAAFEDLMSLIADYLDHAGRPEANVRLLAQGIWTGMHGYVTLAHAGSKVDWPTDEEFATRLAEAWLGPPTRPWRGRSLPAGAPRAGS